MIMSRLEKEQKTIALMIRLFCHAHHGIDKKPLCSSCTDLLEYAGKRLEKCPFGQTKGACSKCSIHCYKPDMREQITQVMRYSGPRMVTRRPLLAIDHLIKPKLSGRKRKNRRG